MIKFLAKCIAVVMVILVLSVLITFISVTSEGDLSQKESTTQESRALYTLSDYKGKIALYKSGYAMPVEIYDVYVESLPQEERAKIESGISAQSDSEIIKIIEAYTS